MWQNNATDQGVVAACDWSKGVPFLCLFTAIGALVAVIGVRDAIAGNGANTTAAAVQNGKQP